MVVLLSAVLALGFACLVQGIHLRRVRRRWRDLLAGTSGENLERMLYDHLRGRVSLEEQVSDHHAQIAKLERRMLLAKSYVGVVRYDAFPDVGGQQSFSMAIYDEDGDGAVITSLVGRADCRVYGKPITKGEGERNLSEEERRAIQEAVRAMRSRNGNL